MGEDTMSDITRKLIEYLVDMKFEHLSKEDVYKAKLRITDVLGCAIAGKKSSSSQIVFDLLKDWGGKPDSTVFVHMERLPTAHTAMVNSVMARAYDYEVSGLQVEGKPIAAHISGTTVPTALAMAEAKKRDGKDLITSLVIGDDITSRIHAASNYTLDSGWDCAGTVNVFGATAIAGKLLNLSPKQFLNAFGIALNQLGGSFQCIWDGAQAFALNQGSSAREGIFAAQLAAKGFSGVKDFMFSRYGFFNLYSRQYEPDMLTRDLGSKFYADVRFKPYPTCGGNDAAINCALNIARCSQIDCDEIFQVILSVTPWVKDSFVAQKFEIGEFPFGSACFNLSYAVANALLRKNTELRNFTDELIAEKNICDLTRKVIIEGRLPPEKGRRAAGLEVIMKDGRRFEEYMDAPEGDPLDKPLAESVIKDKFRSNARFCGLIDDEKIENLLSMIDALEEIDDIESLVALTKV
jgi:2-methylcitrate dehydratase PrpD